MEEAHSIIHGIAYFTHLGDGITVTDMAGDMDLMTSIGVLLIGVLIILPGITHIMDMVTTMVDTTGITIMVITIDVV